MRLFGRRRIRRPVEGHAEVVEAWLRNPGHTSGNCKLTLRLDVPGIPQMDVRHHEHYVNANRWPEVGMRVAVTVDADHPDRVDVDWDSVFGPVLGGPVGHVAQVAAAAVGIDADLSLGVDRQTWKQPENFNEQMAELGRRYGAGEMTPEQYQDEVRKLAGF